MGPVIADDAKTRIANLDGVSEASVDIVWDPPWNPKMISEEGKKNSWVGVGRSGSALDVVAEDQFLIS